MPEVRRPRGGGVSEGRNKAPLGEAGAGSSPAGGFALAGLSHSLAARPETRNLLISPPRCRLAPPPPDCAPHSANEKWKWEAEISSPCTGNPAALGAHINLHCYTPSIRSREISGQRQDVTSAGKLGEGSRRVRGARPSPLHLLAGLLRTPAELWHRVSIPNAGIRDAPAPSFLPLPLPHAPRRALRPEPPRPGAPRGVATHPPAASNSRRPPRRSRAEEGREGEERIPGLISALQCGTV